MHYYWNNWYMGWGWFLWYAIFFLIIFNFGNWGYTYRAHRKLEEGYPHKDAVDILNERYARGDITHEEYIKMKSHILREVDSNMGTAEERKSRDQNQPNAGSLHPTY